MTDEELEEFVRSLKLQPRPMEDKNARRTAEMTYESLLGLLPGDAGLLLAFVPLREAPMPEHKGPGPTDTGVAFQASGEHFNACREDAFSGGDR